MSDPLQQAIKRAAELELKFCPFDHDYSPGDGGGLEVMRKIRGTLEGWYYAWCSCGAQGPVMPTQKMAAEAWNSRHVRPVLEEREQLLMTLVRAQDQRWEFMDSYRRANPTYTVDRTEPMRDEEVRQARAALSAYEEPSDE